MNKLAILAAIALAATVTLATPAVAASPVAHNNRAIVQGDQVRLGDLFRNAGELAKIPVDRAPAAGQSATYHAVQLANIARANGLDWKPNDQFDRVTIERASKMVGRDIVDQAIARALAEQGAPANVEVEISNWQFRLFVPVEKPMTVALANMVYDPQNKRFSGIVTAPADDPAAERAQIFGRIYQVVDVPVLTRRVNPGEAIRKTDIEMMKVRDYQALRGIVVQASQLVGLTPRRQLPERTVLRESDVAPLMLVSRNEVVTMTLHTDTMSLSTQGKALDNGARGESVRVLNTKSNKTVEGVVTGPNTVAVKTSGRVAVN